MLVIRPVTHADIPTCISIRVASLGSLVIGRPPPYPGYIEESEASIQSDLNNKNSHVHHLKVVDTENEGEVIAYAKWEVYEHGRLDLEKLCGESEGELCERGKKKKDSREREGVSRLRVAVHRYFCRSNGEVGKGPHIFLALLVTDPGFRGRGAGGMLVGWGIERAEEMGIPCFVRASEQGQVVSMAWV